MKVDLAIIGGGGAGFAAAAKADELGVQALLINKGLPTGGTCVNIGCVPSKFLLETSFDYWKGTRPRFKSISPRQEKFNFSQALIEKEEVIQRNRRAKYENVLSQFKSVKYYEKRASFEGPGKIRVGYDLVEAKNVLICTGSSNRKLNIPGMDTLTEEDVLDSASAFELKSQPKSMIIIGGGYTGIEVAQMFSHFGTKVVLLEAMDRILPRGEPEISKAVEKLLQCSGIDLHVGAKVKTVRKVSEEVVVEVEIEGIEHELRGERLFVAIGLKGNTEELNLKAIGLETDQHGFIEVDERMRTNVPGVFAAGDVAGPPWLETVAAREGAIAVETAFNVGMMSIDYDNVPTAIFTHPQIASVGLTESELMKRINVCECRTVELKYVPKADITNETLGASKMVIDPRSRKIVGFHLVSPHAAEIIHEATMAIKFGATVEDIIDMVHVFPTFSEVMKITAQAFKKDIRFMSCCIE